MRYMLKNAIRDPRLNARRRQNPGKINRRPIIGGKPLPPGGTKMIRVELLTQKMLDEIEQHHNWGNVQLLQVGRGGGEADFDAIRKLRGWAAKEEPKPAAEAPAPPPAPEPEPEPEPEEVLAAEEADVPAGEPDEGDVEPNLADIEAVEDAIDAQPEDGPEPAPEPMDIEEVLDPALEEAKAETPDYTKSELMSLGKSDLQDVWRTFFPGQKPGAKTKGALSDEILEKQAEGGE